jgi:hypothetical protein
MVVAPPTVRKYQAVGGAVGQGFLQRSIFSNPAFEECVATGAHVATVTCAFCNKHYLCYGNICAVNSSLSEIRRDWGNFLRVYVCIS